MAHRHYSVAVAGRTPTHVGTGALTAPASGAAPELMATPGFLAAAQNLPRPSGVLRPPQLTIPAGSDTDGEPMATPCHLSHAASTRAFGTSAVVIRTPKVHATRSVSPQIPLPSHGAAACAREEQDKLVAVRRSDAVRAQLSDPIDVLKIDTREDSLDGNENGGDNGVEPAVAASSARNDAGKGKSRRGKKVGTPRVSAAVATGTAGSVERRQSHRKRVLA
jgi:hypothetical protein